MVFLKDMSPSHMAPSKDHDADAGLLLADDALPDAHMARAARLRRLQLGCVPNDATNATAPDRVPVAPQTPVSTVFRALSTAAIAGGLIRVPRRAAAVQLTHTVSRACNIALR
jgi:hypothetical protein